MILVVKVVEIAVIIVVNHNLLKLKKKKLKVINKLTLLKKLFRIKILRFKYFILLYYLGSN